MNVAKESKSLPSFRGRFQDGTTKEQHAFVLHNFGSSSRCTLCEGTCLHARLRHSINTPLPRFYPTFMQDMGRQLTKSKKWTLTKHEHARKGSTHLQTTGRSRIQQAREARDQFLWQFTDATRTHGETRRTPPTSARHQRRRLTFEG